MTGHILSGKVKILSTEAIKLVKEEQSLLNKAHGVEIFERS